MGGCSLVVALFRGYVHGGMPSWPMWCFVGFMVLGWAVGIYEWWKGKSD